MYMYRQVIGDVRRKIEELRGELSDTSRKNYFMNFLQQHDKTEEVGEGCHRRVFAVDGCDHVIKVALYTKGFGNNRSDARIARLSDFVPDVPEYDETHNIWMVQKEVDIIKHYDRLVDAVPSFAKHAGHLINKRSVGNFMQCYLRYNYARRVYNEAFASTLPLMYTTDKDFEVYADWFENECELLERARNFFFNHAGLVADFTCHNIGFDDDGDIKFADPGVYQTDHNIVTWWVDVKYQRRNHDNILEEYNDTAA